VSLVLKRGCVCVCPQSESSSSSNISTMLVTQDYVALKEDEINVGQGEVVQILASNQQNMFVPFDLESHLKD